MRRLPIFIISFIWISVFFTSSHASMFEMGKDDIFQNPSAGFVVDSCDLIEQLPNLGADHFQECTDFINAYAFDGDNNTLSPSRISDGFGWGVGALFITGSVTSAPNSFPDSPTMLLLGIGLVSLSGYFGRRTFKR